MLDYDEDVPFAMIAACHYTKELSLATGRPLDPVLAIRAPFRASQLQTLSRLALWRFYIEVCRFVPAPGS